MFWKNTAINEINANFCRPEIHCMDEFMYLGKVKSNKYSDLIKNEVTPFKQHNASNIESFINDLNDKFGKRVYVTDFYLSQLGIILNIETGYLIHLHSTDNNYHNHRFALTANNKFLHSILLQCITEDNVTYQLIDTRKHIQKLLVLYQIPLTECKYKVYQNIQYKLLLDETKLIKDTDIGVVRLYNSPEPLIPIIDSFECDFCLKSFASIRQTQVHINQHHSILVNNKSTCYITKSYSQCTPKGLINVLVSSRFLEFENNFELENKDYKVTNILDSDQMFNYKFVSKFFQNLVVDDLVFYLEYIKNDKKFKLIENYLTERVGAILKSLLKSEIDKSLKIFSEKSLKFYKTSNCLPKFNFMKINNKEQLEKYAKYISQALVILIACFNLKSGKIKTFCRQPQYKIPFTKAQKNLLKNLTDYVVDHVQEDNNSKTKNKLKSFNFKRLEEIFLWSNISKLFIDITLQGKSRNNPLQAIFLLSSCSYTTLSKSLKFHSPTQRNSIFKAFLYGMRLSFISTVNKENDHYYNSLINNATIKGTLNQVMTKIYYPTRLYFTRKIEKFDPFFNSSCYTYTHPVYFVDKLIGCKLLGLYSVKLILEKIKKELNKINKLKDIQCLLIAYLVFSNRPLEEFVNYLNINVSDCTTYTDRIEIQYKGTRLLIVDSFIAYHFEMYCNSRKLHKCQSSKLFCKSTLTAAYVFDKINFKYTDFECLRQFLVNCHNLIFNRQNSYHKDWLDKILASSRVQGESYLIMDFDLVKRENQKYIDYNKECHTSLYKKQYPLNDLENTMEFNTIKPKFLKRSIDSIDELENSGFLKKRCL